MIDLGPSESPHDSPWVLGDDEKVVFLGDQIYDHKHCYLADGFYAEWLANIQQAARSVSPTTLSSTSVTAALWVPTCGTGNAATSRRSSTPSPTPTGRSPNRQRQPSWLDEGVRAVNELQMLMELSIEPVAAEQGCCSRPEAAWDTRMAARTTDDDPARPSSTRRRSAGCSSSTLPWRACTLDRDADLCGVVR